MKNTPIESPRKLPPLSELPKCATCTKPYFPLVPGAEHCFACAMAAKRGGK